MCPQKTIDRLFDKSLTILYKLKRGGSETFSPILDHFLSFQYFTRRQVKSALSRTLPLNSLTKIALYRKIH